MLRLIYKLMQNLPYVALVGRPNVGKSTLFNRLVGSRQAVVADIAGTTRDRLERTLSIQGKNFILVDMAGLEPTLTDTNEIKVGMQRQVQAALGKATVILWIVDSAEGVTTADRVVAELLRRLGKPVILVANKADHPMHEARAMEFAEFGFEGVYPISAMHNRGMNELMTAFCRDLPATVGEKDVDTSELRIALVGRPNVGKSTLLNVLVGEDRSITSPIAGTTRDSIDTILPAREVFGRTFAQWKTIRFVDTAGIRRRGKIDRSIEGWSVVRSYDAIDAAHVTLLLLDGKEGLVNQDMQVINRVTEAGKPLILLVNKWDAVLNEAHTESGSLRDSELREEVLNKLRVALPFMPWVQVLFLSATTKLNVPIIAKLVLEAHTAWSRIIPQSDLDELAEHLKTFPRLTKIMKSMTQEHACPPVFHVHVKGRDIPHFSTIRHIDNMLRESFDLGPTPIRVWIKLKKRKEDSGE